MRTFVSRRIAFSRTHDYTDYKDLQNASFLILSEANLQKCIKDELQWNDFLAVENFVTKKQEYLDDVRKRTTIDRAEEGQGHRKGLHHAITYKDEDPKRPPPLPTKSPSCGWQAASTRCVTNIGRSSDDARTAFEKAQNRVGVARQEWRISRRRTVSRQPNPRVERLAVDEDPVFKLLLQARETLVRAETDWRSQEEKRMAGLSSSTRRPPTEVEEVVDSKTAAASPQAEGVKPLHRLLERD